MKHRNIGMLTVLFACLALIPKSVQKLNFEGLEKRAVKANDTLYVVNFWATWCRPCVAEMPFFFESAKQFSDQKVKIIFVSLNSAKEIEKVKKFAADKKIQQEMYLWNEGNPNSWIDKIDPSWGGSIPATVMYRNKQKVFFREGEFEQEDLNSVITSKLK